MILGRRFILASASPRRSELLREVVPDFDVVVSDVEEDPLTTLDPWETARTLAIAKASAVAKLHPDAIVLGGDTVVAFMGLRGWEQLAKPTDREHAEIMLATLSGRTHIVVTGIALAFNDRLIAAVDTTEVRFRVLTPDEIHDYVASGEPMDKAGGYAIQGGAAGFIQERKGSLSNVIGLPLEALQKLLSELE